MSPAPFFRDQTLLLKPLFPPSVALTSTFFPRADTYEQSDVLTRMALKKERGVERRILIRGDENGNTSGAEGAGIHEPPCWTFKCRINHNSFWFYFLLLLVVDSFYTNNTNNRKITYMNNKYIR